MPSRSTRHATFVIERVFNASPARVFGAFSDPRAKARWFLGPDGWEKQAHELDFRVGGRERGGGRLPGGPVYSFRGTYQEIVPERRILYTYDMLAGDTLISVSLVTFELEPAGAGTRLVLTEQGVFLDGSDTPEQREQGTHALLDQLELELKRADG